jgi:hypothetical protein
LWQIVFGVELFELGVKQVDWLGAAKLAEELLLRLSPKLAFHLNS